MNESEFKSTVSAWIATQVDSPEEAINRFLRFKDLHEILKEGIAHFWFKKNDGSMRSAYGTLNMTIIERHGGITEGEERKSKAFTGAVPYYDLEKDAWRSFKADAIQEIDFAYGNSLA